MKKEIRNWSVGHLWRAERSRENYFFFPEENYLYLFHFSFLKLIFKDQQRMVENCKLACLLSFLPPFFFFFLFFFLFGLPVMFAFGQELTFLPWRKDYLLRVGTPSFYFNSGNEF